jgi:hypothetical protein
MKVFVQFSHNQVTVMLSPSLPGIKFLLGKLFLYFLAIWFKKSLSLFVLGPLEITVAVGKSIVTFNTSCG